MNYKVLYLKSEPLSFSFWDDRKKVIFLNNLEFESSFLYWLVLRYFMSFHILGLCSASKYISSLPKFNLLIKTLWVS